MYKKKTFCQQKYNIGAIANNSKQIRSLGGGECSHTRQGLA